MSTKTAAAPAAKVAAPAVVAPAALPSRLMSEKSFPIVFGIIFKSISKDMFPILNLERVREAGGTKGATKGFTGYNYSIGGNEEFSKFFAKDNVEIVCNLPEDSRRSFISTLLANAEVVARIERIKVVAAGRGYAFPEYF